MTGLGWVFHFRNRFVGQKLHDAECLLTCSTVMLNNEASFTVSVCKFCFTAIVPIFTHLPECTRFRTFSSFYRICRISDVHCFHYLARYHDPWTVYITQKHLTLSQLLPTSLGEHCTSVTCIPS